MISIRCTTDALDGRIERALAVLTERKAMSRLWDRDPTLFGADPSEVADRMGWLDAPGDSADSWDGVWERCRELVGDAAHVVVMGMGGSSLFPEVLARTFAPTGGFPRLHIVDSTDPASLRRALDAAAPDSTFHVASSKSGSTLETRCHLALFWERSKDPSRFAVITDPGSALGRHARELGFAHVFENNPDIGGRYSALSGFGMVPAAMSGVDGNALLEAALDQLDSLEPVGDDHDNEAARLAAVIAAGVETGRDKLTVLIDPRVATFGLWLEQLVAESLGKGGIGSVPVVGEALDHIVATGTDRVIVTIGDVAGRDRLRASGIPLVELSLEETTDLGAQIVVWEVAVALAGVVLRVNPFDQPDVEAAKLEARRLLDADDGDEIQSTSLADACDAVEPGDYVAICAFVDPGGVVAERLERARHTLGVRLGIATTLGFGPRFLHSTGQLHKGGGGNVVVFQVVGAEPGPTDDLAIPAESFTFGQLERAQADGDLAALAGAGKRAFRIPLAELMDLG